MEVKLEDIDTPFLWVDLDIMEDNISSLSSFFKSKICIGDPTSRASRHLKLHKKSSIPVRLE